MNTPVRAAVEITPVSDVRFLSAELQPLILDASARARLLEQGYVVDHPSAFGSAQHAPGWVGGLPGLPEKAE